MISTGEGICGMTRRFDHDSKISYAESSESSLSHHPIHPSYLSSDKSPNIARNADGSDTTADHKSDGRWLPNLYFYFNS